uniref:uncharacterized protein LOC122784014 isoform X2 n=1 Tax=Solea senegalensis TaxID=28829 RepID=UPI001CD8D2E8|nr:uncharacterized protein LOC122784014 isoform X2 [Solea senegalensis]
MSQWQRAAETKTRRRRRRMVNFRRFVVFSCGILVLRFTASVAQLFTSIIVRPGGEVTLPCENMVDENCASTTWLFGRSPLSPSTVLVRSGRVVVPETEPERLRVTANCSLVLKEVTEEDVGRYGCRNTHTSKDSQVELSVINMNTQTKGDGKKVKFTCSVTTYGNCSLTVKWLHVKTKEDKDNKDMKISDCLSTLASQPHHVLYALRKFLTCEVTDRRTHKVELFTFNPESTGKNKSESENKERKPPLEVLRVLTLTETSFLPVRSSAAAAAAVVVVLCSGRCGFSRSLTKRRRPRHVAEKQRKQKQNGRNHG